MAQPIYKHTQPGYVIIIGIGVIFLFLAMRSDVGILWFAPLLVIMTLFSTLTVTVDSDYLTWYFGPGLWKYQRPLSDLSKIGSVTNKWWYGFGIRYLPSGKLYNVSGLSAVSIALSNGETIRLGTNEPEALLDALNARNL